MLCLSFQFSAQTTDALINKARKLQKNLEFQEAIDLYEQALSKETKPEALFALPNCYRMVGNHLKAGEWYAKAAEHPEAPSDVFFYYGLMLMSNDKFEDAGAQFAKFKEKDNAQLRGLNLVKACTADVRKDLLNAGLYLMYLLCPMLTRDTTILALHSLALIYYIVLIETQLR